MAPGPLPKPPEQRARRNVPARGEWTDLAPLTKPGLPPLPKRHSEVWHPRAERLWKGLRWDPACATFGRAEVAMALEAIHIYDAAVRNNESPAFFAQALKWLDVLGLTPKGKRDLRLRVIEEEVGPALASVSPIPTRRPRK